MEKRKILAVDDNAVNLAAIEQALQDDYDVMLMTGGKRAVKYLGVKQADLVLLDVSMPVMDGIETLEEIRRLEHGKDVPVIFLTASNDWNVAQEGERLGIADYITKPFEAGNLRRRIAKVLAVR